MASMKVPSGGHCISIRNSGRNLCSGIVRMNINLNIQTNRIVQSCCSTRGPSMSATTKDSSVSAARTVNLGSGKKRSLFPEKLDEWMQDSAAEIVKNLREAPLFVQVFADDNGEAARLETEKAIAEDWPVVTRKWKNGEAPSPDGVILVEELGGGEEEDVEEEKGTRAWGIVVQGKGVKSRPACYLLKTSQVRSGLGTCCTHFCLMKVQGFRQSALSQLTNCWLLE